MDATLSLKHASYDARVLFSVPPSVMLTRLKGALAPASVSSGTYVACRLAVAGKFVGERPKTHDLE
jgi:hypothetical protein